MNILERIWEQPIEYAFVIGVPLFLFYVMYDAVQDGRKDWIAREPEEYRAYVSKCMYWIVFVSAILVSIIYIKGN